MNAKLHLISALAASLTLHGAAMPTEAEVEKAVPKVERMLASEKVALASGKMTRAEVAAAAMKLAAGADDEAAKLLLMKGAFILHVKDGDLEKAVKTMNALETAIADMPPQIVTNIIETALLGLPNKTANGARLYQLLDATKITEKSTITDGENFKAVVDGYTWTYRVSNGEAEIMAEKDGKPCCAISPSPIGDLEIPSILGGVRVTGIGNRAFSWCDKLTSVTLPESVTRVGRSAFSCCRSLTSVTMHGECPFSQQNVFYICHRLAAIHVSVDCKSWAGMKEWQGVPLVFDGEPQGQMTQTAKDAKRQVQTETEKAQRNAEIAEQRAQLLAIQEEVKRARAKGSSLGGMRRQGLLGGTLRARRLQRQQEAQKAISQEKVDGYTWSFRVNSGEAEIVAENSGNFTCAVSPTPTGDITIPLTLGGAKVTSIGREALKGCDKITSVMMPLTLTRVGRDAFNGCRCLESLEMPPNIRDIEVGAFAGCCALTTVTIPSNVVRVGCAVFAGCTGLKQINVEEGNPNYTSVDGVLCTKDRSVLVMWPFGRVEVTIPPEVKVLGQWSFLDFDALKTITVPPTVTRIGWGAFHGCDGLASVTIPSSVRDIDGCTFRECGGLESVTIPEGVTNIAYCAFYCCRKLASVTIPSSVRSIGVVAFEQCALTSVTIPSGVETLGEGAFKSCGRLATVKISEGVTSISKEAFKGCGALTSLTIPESVRSIEQAAFYECGNLTSVTLPRGLRAIGGNAFMCCTKLKPVTIPASVTNVGGAAFAYCPEIKEHNLAADNQSLISVDAVLYTKDGKELVACPSGKTSVNILESVTNILSGSITGCGELTSLTIPPNVGIIGSWALSGSGVTSITLPQGLPCIEGATFWGCHDLTSVTIPDSVTSIGGNAFRWCGKLTTVTIPKGVKSIGGEAFYDCGGLTSITMCGERPDAPNNVFKGCRNLKSIHVPANATSWAGMTVWLGIPLVFDAK